MDAAALKKERGDEEQSLPDDIIFNILLSLPFIHVVQLRCLSKTWYSLLTDSQFLKLHRHRHHRPNRLMILLSLPCFQEEETHVPTIHPPPLLAVVTGVSIQGSCHGFILLYKFRLHSLFLWNPITRASIELPHPPKISELNTNFLLSGFGFDPISHDYKILILNNWCRYAQLYTRKTNSWKIITEDALKLFGYVSGGGILVSGCLHWSTRPIKGKDEKIVSFDLAKEKFKFVPAPISDELTIQNELPIQVCALEGLLAIVNYSNFAWNLWVMKEYGVEESWTKLMTISTSTEIRMWCKPLCLTDNGELIIHVFENKIVKYNPKAKAGEEFKILMEDEFSIDSIMFDETTQII